MSAHQSDAVDDVSADDIAEMPPHLRELVRLTILAFKLERVPSEEVHRLGDAFRSGELNEDDYLEALEGLIWAWPS